MSKENLVIVGYGAQGRLTRQIVQSNSLFEFIGYVDNFRQDDCLGGVNELEKLKDKIDNLVVFVAVGHNGHRQEYCEYIDRLNIRLASIVHPKAAIEKSAKIGKNVFIGALAAINNASVLEDGVYINTGSIVEHDNIIKEFTHLAPGVVTGGKVRVGRKVFVGLGSRIANEISIGDLAFICMGSVVNKNVGEGLAVGGAPAQERHVSEEARSAYQ